MESPEMDMERTEVEKGRKREKEKRKREKERTIEVRKRVSPGSYPREDTGRTYGGSGGTATMTATDFTRVLLVQILERQCTCAREHGRDDTAPYWTALRKYNGAPLLRYVHPNHDVGVGATPPPRSAP